MTVRGQRVMLDATLASIYDVPLKALNQQVKRNPARFPANFAFQLTTQEVAQIRSQFVTGSSPIGFHLREVAPPYRVKIHHRR